MWLWVWLRFFLNPINRNQDGVVEIARIYATCGPRKFKSDYAELLAHAFAGVTQAGAASGAPTGKIQIQQNELTPKPKPGAS